MLKAAVLPCRKNVLEFSIALVYDNGEQDMLLPNHGRRDTKRVFVLALVVMLLGFSIWLKMSPNLGKNLDAGSSQIVKLWVDPSYDSNNQVKLATVGSFLLLIAVAAVLIVAPDRLLHFTPVFEFSATDTFMKSRHWFRPPPLF